MMKSAVFGLLLIVQVVFGDVDRFDCKEEHDLCMDRKVNAAFDLIQPCFSDNKCSNPLCTRYGIEDYMMDHCPNLAPEEITESVLETMRGAFGSRKSSSPARVRRSIISTVKDPNRPSSDPGCNWGQFFPCAAKVFTQIMRGPTAPMDPVEESPEESSEAEEDDWMAEGEESDEGTGPFVPKRRRKRSNMIAVYMNKVMKKFEVECDVEGGRSCYYATKRKMTSDEAEESESKKWEFTANLCDCLDRMKLDKMMEAIDNGCEGRAPKYVTDNIPDFIHAMGNQFCRLNYVHGNKGGDGE